MKANSLKKHKKKIIINVNLNKILKSKKNSPFSKKIIN